MTQYRMRASKEIIAQEFPGIEPGAAFTHCFEQKCTPAYMPELLRFKIDASAESNLWQQWYSSASIIITGRSKQGNAVIAFDHTQNPLNNSTKIRETIALGLQNGAGTLPIHEFYQILDNQDDTNIFVIDYNPLPHTHIQEIPLNDALTHPFVISFCGGKEIAQQYLQKYSQVTKKKTITISYRDDAHLRPLARLLYLADDSSFDAHATLESGNYLLGLKENTLFQSRTKSNSQNSQYSIDDLLALAKQYVAPIVLQQYEAQLRILAGTQHSAKEYSPDFPPPLPTKTLPLPSRTLPPPDSSSASSNSHRSSSHDLVRQQPHPPISNALTNPSSLSPLHRLIPIGKPTTTFQLAGSKKR